jgi:hypothetical protein
MPAFLHRQFQNASGGDKMPHGGQLAGAREVAAGRNLRIGVRGIPPEQNAWEQADAICDQTVAGAAAVPIMTA